MIAVPTYDEFIETIVECTKNNMDVSEWDIRENKIIELQWSVGGMEGGNCWNDGACDPVSPQTPKTIEPIMDLIFEALCPDIKFMTYRRLIRELECEVQSKTEYEYYGNYTEYHKISLNLQRLYDLMIENELFQ